jgi:CarD family transcriptional regulator
MFVWQFGSSANVPVGRAAPQRQRGGWLYDVGDKVVYPHHGAGKVIKKEMKEVLGQNREYLTIQILYNDMTVMVPAENAERAGLRKVIGEETVAEVLAVLRDDGSQMPKNWNRRFKHNRDKIKTGDIFELAEVVRNLALRDIEKGLSTGEKQMFGRAKKILASELMYARDMEEEEANEFLDGLLDEVAHERIADGRLVPMRDSALLFD